MEGITHVRQIQFVLSLSQTMNYVVLNYLFFLNVFVMWYKYIISKLKKDGSYNVIIVTFYVCVDIRLPWWYCNNSWRI